MRDSERIRERLDQFLDGEIAVGSFPGAVYAIATSTDVIVASGRGFSVTLPARIEVTPSTIYDLASVTKPLVTTTLALIAASRGLLDLDEPINRLLPELPPDKQAITAADLLAHRSGLEAWYPAYAFGTTAESYLRVIASRPLAYERGSGTTYSDPGFILLHLALERLFGRPGVESAKREIFEPLSLRNVWFSPPRELLAEVAATEWGNVFERELAAARGVQSDVFRTELIWGSVNDGHAFHLGGYSGTAGLFARAEDVVRLARVYLGGTLIERRMVARSLTLQTGGDDRRGLGWQLRSERVDHPSAPFSEGNFGHTGFTGTSVWIDPERDLIVVLLTNRIHPLVPRRNFQLVRAAFHRQVVASWDGG